MCGCHNLTPDAGIVLCEVCHRDLVSMSRLPPSSRNLSSRVSQLAVTRRQVRWCAKAFDCLNFRNESGMKRSNC